MLSRCCSLAQKFPEVFGIILRLPECLCWESAPPTTHPLGSLSHRHRQALRLILVPKPPLKLFLFEKSWPFSLPMYVQNLLLLKLELPFLFVPQKLPIPRNFPYLYIVFVQSITNVHGCLISVDVVAKRIVSL